MQTMKIILKILILIVFLYIFSLFLLWFFQEKFIFFPSKDNPYVISELKNNPYIKHITKKTPDDIILDGWIQTYPDKQKTIILFAGNATNVTNFIGDFSIPNANIISFNYRSYGSSSGKASEKNLFSDALFIYDSLILDGLIDSKEVYIMGISLGTGVATFLSSQREVSGVILVTPYDSIESVSKSKFPFFPIKFLLRNKFLSTKFSILKENPVLIIYAGNDKIIKNYHTENLIKHWNGDIKKLFIAEADHNNVLDYAESRQAIENFIQ
ncbi:hypothetical protein DLH72_02605 [Candidatus Gracilibacteria bacterium]|nr:MAG: hypothetical protein DLH72_02605 [Candidatus Gracilibacteria bacterium]